MSMHGHIVPFQLRNRRATTANAAGKRSRSSSLRSYVRVYIEGKESVLPFNLGVNYHRRPQISHDIGLAEAGIF